MRRRRRENLIVLSRGGREGKKEIERKEEKTMGRGKEEMIFNGFPVSYLRKFEKNRLRPFSFSRFKLAGNEMLGE